jgi:NADH-quinone oxidoreductase subunit L
MFHLFTHAFFKALLFLGAGSVIHAMHHEQDMRFYGGLRKSIPITFWAMTIGTLAITGVGVAGLFGFAGFYSKDAIIESAFASGTDIGGIAFAVGVFAALLTSFYSWRLVFLTFFGTPRWAASEHIQHAVHGDHHDAPSEEHGDSAHHDVHAPEGTAGYHPHESPWSMLVPLIVLSLGALLAGYVFDEVFLSPEHGLAFWKGSLFFDEHLMHARHEVPEWVKYSATAAWIIGLIIAWYAYLKDTTVPERFTASFRGLYAFLLNKWYFDELYNLIFVRPAFALGRFLWKRGDEGTIDRFGPNGVAAVVAGTSRVSGRLQSGYVYTYAFVMLIGLAGAATWAIAG